MDFSSKDSATTRTGVQTVAQPRGSQDAVRKPVLIYALASAGMGHITRAVPLLQRLSDTYEIHIFCSGQANQWIAGQFPNVHQNHPIRAAFAGEKVHLAKTVAQATLVHLPRSMLHICRIARFILRHRPRALITDFEAHSTYAALLTRPIFRVPIISCDHWTGLRMSAVPFALSADEARDLNRWRKIIRLVVSYADRYLVHGTMKTRLNNDRARYVPTPVRDAFLEAGRNTTADGPVVVSMGHLAPHSLTEILADSRHQFVIFGSKNPRKTGNVEYRAFNEAEYIEAMRRSPFVIVSANSSAIDALAMHKPLLYCPRAGHFEQKYCGKMFEHLGVARFVDALSAQAIDGFAAQLAPYEAKARTLDIFDNDGLAREVEQAIAELA